MQTANLRSDLDTTEGSADDAYVVGGYTTPREYLDDLVVLVERMLERAVLAVTGPSETDQRLLAELDLDVARRHELLAARRDATALHGEPELECQSDAIKRRRPRRERSRFSRYSRSRPALGALPPGCSKTRRPPRPSG